MVTRQRVIHRTLHVGRAILAAGLIAGVAGVALVGPGAQHAAATVRSADRSPAPSGHSQTQEPSESPTNATTLLRVASVTSWVAPGQTWEARLRPDPSVSPGATVSVTVHAAITGTDQAVSDRLDDQRNGDELGRPVASLPTRRVLELLASDGTVRIAVEVAGDTPSTTAISLPRAGIYPVEVELASDTGTPIESRVLHLVVVETDPTRTSALRAVVVVRADDRDAFTNDGPADLGAARSMAQRTLTILENQRSAGVTTVLRAETLEALAQSSVPEDRSLLDRVLATLRPTRAIKVPWAATHTDAWMNQGGSGEIRRSLIAAQDTYSTLAGQILDPRVWVPDDTIGNRTLAPLARLGVDQLLVDNSRLETARLPRGERGFSRPLRAGSGASVLPAMVADPAVAAELASDAEPPLAAHRAVTRLAAQSLSLTDSGPRSPRGGLVVLDQRVAPETAEAFVSSLVATTANAPIRVTPPETLFTDVRPLTRNTDGSGSTVVRAFREVASRPNLAGAIAGLPTTWSRAEATRRMRPTNDPMISSLRVDLLSVTRRSSSEQQRRSSLDRANALNDETLSAITSPARRTVTVTARESAIPLRLENTSAVPLRVRIAFESPRLEFKQGEELEIELQPGVNRFNMPVSVRSSGVFAMRVRVTSPNAIAPRPPTADRYPLASSTITVRSTTFSGVGLILSGGALIVLVIWWARTLSRRDPSPEETLPPSEVSAH